MHTVYLAGPISGCSYDEAVDWREGVIGALAGKRIKGLSPMRCKNYLEGMKDLDKNCIEYGAINCLSSPRGIMTRDRFDCTRCDVLLVNLLGAKKVSIGTVMEIAWADLSRIPIIVVMEPGNIHEHAMVSEAIGFRVGTLNEAIDLVVGILG